MRATAKSSSKLKSLGVTYALPTKPARPDGEMNRLMDAMRAKRDRLTLSAKHLLQSTAWKITSKYSGMSKRIDVKMCNMTELSRRRKIMEKIPVFYDENGVHLPGKRSVCMKTRMQKKILTMSLRLSLPGVHCRTPRGESVLQHVAWHTLCRSRKSQSGSVLGEVCINPMLKMNVLNSLLSELIESLPMLISQTIWMSLRTTCVSSKISHLTLAAHR